jgi:hypothetical protein
LTSKTCTLYLLYNVDVSRRLSMRESNEPNTPNTLQVNSLLDFMIAWLIHCTVLGCLQGFQEFKRLVTLPILNM